MTQLIIGMFIGIVTGALLMRIFLVKEVRKARILSDKHLEMVLLMYHWILNYQNGKCIKKVLERNNYKSVAIYGMGYIGKCLYKQLKKEMVEIGYVMDKNKNLNMPDIEYKKINDDLDTVDAIIVTALYYFDEIEMELNNRFKGSIVSAADIIFKM